MRIYLPLFACLVLGFGNAARSAEPKPSPSTSYPLFARIEPEARADMTVMLDVGGELIVPGKEEAQTRLPMSVAAKLNYVEQLLPETADASAPVRSLRRYREARATIKTQQQGVERELPEDRRVVVAALGERGAALAGLDQPLTRDQFDLLDVVGNTLAIDELLPNRELKEGEGWDHEAATIGRLLGMDHVAVCDVRSVATGEENRQVQIRLGGTVHGTVEGAATEMELRAAYLYHLDEGRITKLNLAIKERRKMGEVTPGLDVVAKLSIVAKPLAKTEPATFDEATIAKAAAQTEAALRQLLVDAPQRGYRFRHDSSWYATAEQRELMSLRLIDGGDLLAHCNVTTRPPRKPDGGETIAEFERDVSQSLGKKLQKVEAAQEWKTAAGHRCLGIFANGTVDEVPMQWRYYRISGENLPEATISVTVEQAQLERFADADRPLVDSLELIALPAAKTATKPQAAAK